MTLHPCYRAACDAPNCTARVFLAHTRTARCRAQLVLLGWLIIPTRPHARAPGAPRILYLCPAHHDARPEGWRQARASTIRRLALGRVPKLGLLTPMQEPGEHIKGTAQRAFVIWALVEATRSPVVVKRATGLSHQQVNHMVTAYIDILEQRQQSAAGWIEPWAKRLRAAGAIP